jgi:hypothetical protein
MYFILQIIDILFYILLSVASALTGKMFFALPGRLFMQRYKVLIKGRHIARIPMTIDFGRKIFCQKIICQEYVPQSRDVLLPEIIHRNGFRTR